MNLFPLRPKKFRVVLINTATGATMHTIDTHRTREQAEAQCWRLIEANVIMAERGLRIVAIP